jgi:hypothetical protein
MAVVATDVYNHGLPPAEEEVAGSRANDDGCAKPGVDVMKRFFFDAVAPGK